MEILKTVRHPHIVKLIDFVTSEHCVYLVMEPVMGGHLQATRAPPPLSAPRRRLRRCTRAPPPSQARLHGGHYYEEHRARLLFAQARPRPAPRFGALPTHALARVCRWWRRCTICTA